MATILFVEDNEHIMHINTTAFRMEGYNVLAATTIHQAENLLMFHDVDLIILDILLPDGNGIDFCKKLKAKQNTPILFLSALGENEDIIHALRSGGDDYLSKPYDLEVLIARVEVRLRDKILQDRFIQFGEMKLDTISMQANIRGEDLGLSKKEFALLLLLVKKANHIVPKEEIQAIVWGQDNIGHDQTLWTIISRLKKKIRCEEFGFSITLKRGEGYILARK